MLSIRWIDDPGQDSDYYSDSKRLILGLDYLILHPILFLPLLQSCLYTEHKTGLFNQSMTQRSCSFAHCTGTLNLDSSYTIE